MCCPHRGQNTTQANIALVKNNAAVGADIAVALADLQQQHQKESIEDILQLDIAQSSSPARVSPERVNHARTGASGRLGSVNTVTTAAAPSTSTFTAAVADTVTTGASESSGVDVQQVMKGSVAVVGSVVLDIIAQPQAQVKKKESSLFIQQPSVF